MIELTGITWDHPRGRAPLDASASLWLEREQVKVRWEARSLKDFGDAPLEELAQIFDLLVIDHPHAGVAAASHCLHALDTLLDLREADVIRADAWNPSARSYWYSGHLWALPVDAACQVSCRRLDLLPEPPPDTWEDVFKLSDQLRSQSRFIGMALCPTDTLCSFLTLCAQGGSPFREDRDGFPAEDTATESLVLLRRLADVCHPASLSWNPIRLYDHMAAQDDVAFSPLAFGYTNYSRPGYAQKHLEFGPIPGKRGALLGGAGLAISSHSAHPVAAAKYAAWVCSAEFQSGPYTTTGGQPAHPAAWEDTEADLAAGGFLSRTRSTLASAYTRPRHPGWPPFQELLGERIHHWLRSGGPPGDVLKELRHAFQQSFAGHTG